MFISIMIISYMVVGFFVGRKIATDGRKSFKKVCDDFYKENKALVDEAGGAPPEKVLGWSATIMCLFTWPIMLYVFPADKK